jgi:hypothetical protein
MDSVAYLYVTVTNIVISHYIMLYIIIVTLTKHVTIYYSLLLSHTSTIASYLFAAAANTATT